MSFEMRFGVSQKVVQSAKITPNEAEVTSSNLLHSSCVDMSKKKKELWWRTGTYSALT